MTTGSSTHRDVSAAAAVRASRSLHRQTRLPSPAPAVATPAAGASGAAVTPGRSASLNRIRSRSLTRRQMSLKTSRGHALPHVARVARGYALLHAARVASGHDLPHAVRVARGHALSHAARAHRPRRVVVLFSRGIAFS